MHDFKMSSYNYYMIFFKNKKQKEVYAYLVMEYGLSLDKMIKSKRGKISIDLFNKVILEKILEIGKIFEEKNV